MTTPNLVPTQPVPPDFNWQGVAIQDLDHEQLLEVCKWLSVELADAYFKFEALKEVAMWVAGQLANKDQ